LLEAEDRKLLHKRKKRTTKVEECPLDLDLYISESKRQRLTEMFTPKTASSEDDVTMEADAVAKLEQRG
jgi:hypothetical protein